VHKLELQLQSALLLRLNLDFSRIDQPATSAFMTNCTCS